MIWLPAPTLREHAGRLVLDFLLLMCACRQMLVFRIEKQYENAEFPGGSNKSVVNEIDNLGSGEVPLETHDFVSIQKNWLDILKCAIFLGCFWITLAIVFLAGTNHVNIFSIGYLIGSFIFLWQGADFYLRPINTILRWWSFLVSYNIFVITVKIILHLPVCIFIKSIEDYLSGYCFLIKWFGITCPELGPRIATSGTDTTVRYLQAFTCFYIEIKMTFVCFFLCLAMWPKRGRCATMGLHVLRLFDIPASYIPELLFLSYYQRK